MNRSLNLKLALASLVGFFTIVASLGSVAQERESAPASLSSLSPSSSSASLLPQEPQTLTLGAAPAEPVFMPVEEAYQLAAEQVGPNEILLLWQIQP
ncbi:MAG: hypothetical protein AAF680_09805, partial [Pseudomonadota bacterium]